MMNWVDIFGLDIDDPSVGGGDGSGGCKTFVFSKTVGPLSSKVMGRVDVTLGITFNGVVRQCSKCCDDGRVGSVYVGDFSASLGLEVGFAPWRIHAGFSLARDHIFGYVDGWVGFRVYGGFRGVGKVLMRYDTCTERFNANGDASIDGYVGLEVGGSLKAAGWLDAGWFGEYDFDVGFSAVGTGRLTGRYRPALSCTKETCVLRGPYSLQLNAFVDVTGSVKGYKFGRRFDIGDTGEMPVTNDLSFQFPNVF